MADSTMQDVESAVQKEMENIMFDKFRIVELIVYNNPKAVMDNLVEKGHHVTSEDDVLDLLRIWYESKQTPLLKSVLQVQLQDHDPVVVEVFNRLAL